jgi:hypothetical protein
MVVMMVVVMVLKYQTMIDADQRLSTWNAEAHETSATASGSGSASVSGGGGSHAAMGTNQPGPPSTSSATAGGEGGSEGQGAAETTSRMLTALMLEKQQLEEKVESLQKAFQQRQGAGDGSAADRAAAEAKMNEQRKAYRSRLKELEKQLAEFKKAGG